MSIICCAMRQSWCAVDATPVPPLQPRRSSLNYSVRQAASTAELRAAAYLRAQSFNTYPADRSEFARRSHLRMKADETWQGLEQRVIGLDTHFAGIQVFPLIAAAPSVQGEQDLRIGLDDLSCTLPADGQSPAEVVVGTLDLNIGIRLPSESLVGRHPSLSTSEAAKFRAYLSDVCVLQTARRQGIGKALIDEAVRKATENGIPHLYVHVVVDNVAAKRLYMENGFDVEQEETEGFARGQNRPRRELLYRRLS